MAAPHIALVSPAYGPAFGGNLISILGADFNTTYTTGLELAPVAVTINGAPAKAVYVISTGQLWVEIPTYRGDATQATFPAVSITVTNLDAVGVAIPGETVTKASCYTYQRAPLLPSSTVPIKKGASEQVVHAFLARLARDLTPNIGWQAHVDFGIEGATEIAKKTMPCIETRIAQRRDHEFGQWDNVRQKKLRVGGDGYDVYRPAKSWMFIFDLLLSEKNEGVLLRLLDNLRDSQETYPYLRVAGDSIWDPAGNNEFPLELGEFQQASNPSNVPLVVFAVQMRVRGVRIMPTAPVDYANTYTSATLSLLQTGSSSLVPV